TCGITATLSDDPFELKAATVGRPLPHTEVKIINAETGTVLPVGERGELCCRGYLVMVGYYKMPEKTAEVIDAEGWLYQFAICRIKNGSHSRFHLITEPVFQQASPDSATHQSDGHIRLETASTPLVPISRS